MADKQSPPSGRNDPPDPSHQTSLRGLADDLRNASDSAVLRITRVVDGLVVRGATDQLLDGLRPRLSTLRPVRPPTFGRVLFAALDPLIVADRDWNAGSPSIPRCLLAPVLASIRRQLADRTDIEASLAAGAPPDPDLWLRAASILAEHTMPAECSQPGFLAATGLTPQVVQSLVGVIRLVFTHAATFRAYSRTDEAASEMIRPLLKEAARTGPLAWSIVLALLFEHSPSPAALLDDVLAMARQTAFARPLERGLQNALGAVIDRMDACAEPIAVAGPATDKTLILQARYAARLAGFTALAGKHLAGRHLAGRHLAGRHLAGRLAHRAREVAISCSALLAEGLRAAPEDCLPPNPMTPSDEAEAAERLETRLHVLRRLDLASRPLGHATDREEVLANAAAFYVGSPTLGQAERAAPKWLTRADRLRLCEILVGAETALRLANTEDLGQSTSA